MTNQAIRNALDDLETAADELDPAERFNADMIRESVETIRDELGVRHD